ncbi:MAG: type I-E CRISPR-associated endonuclease Cas1 [Acidobacteria bacterium]|nr:type I-E CRISPR-associated endonuclease Cas1 [Acidobacteriota bacterium]
MKDLHALPKVRDSFSYLYVEHKKIDQEDKAIALHDASGKVPVPCASLTALLLGPGTSITHAAVKALADNGCLVLWTGEGGVRFYAQGTGETRSARHLLHQARLSSDPAMRLQVVRKLYEMRFPEPLENGLTLQQIRGREGIRVREAYAKASRDSGVEWKGRAYQRDKWEDADPINRALSCAHSCLYGVCHAAIVSAGFSPALGFIHTGKMLSFVYDVADLYKAEITVPISFQMVAEGSDQLETRVRRACRDRFYKDKLLQRIVPDIQQVLGIGKLEDSEDFDRAEDPPGSLWDSDSGETAGGKNYADQHQEDDYGSDHS